MKEKRKIRKGLAIFLMLFVLLGIGGVYKVSVQAAQGITAEEYWKKAWPFVEDARFRTGAPYGPRSPKISAYPSNGCCAYAADFCAYVYGLYNAWDNAYFTPFYNFAEIQSGDIIQIAGHWFVVVERNGSELMTAEGNVNESTANCTRNHYKIEGNALINLWHNSYETLIVGYHYNFSPSVAVPGKTRISVSVSSGSNQVRVSWSATENTDCYDLVIYDASSNTRVDRITDLTSLSYSRSLSAGRYFARIASKKGILYTVSDDVYFTVPKTHTHNYQKKITKATLYKNGTVGMVCSCGKVKPGTTNTTIYYPKTVKLSKTSYSYDGWTKTPKVTVIGSNGKTINSRYYSVQYPSGRKTAGTYTVKVKFKDIYSGTVSLQFKIDARKHNHRYSTSVVKATTTKNGQILRKCSCGTIASKTPIYYPKTIKLSSTTYSYDGKSKKPKVTVIGSNGKTISNKNYSVSYSSGRKNVGTYRVTIKFKGNYSGTVTKTFKIVGGWIYTDKLPTGVTSSGYTIQYKNTYTKTENYYENSGSVYGSLWPLSVSNERVSAGYRYFHYCSGWKGAEVNYEQTSDFVHYDEVSPSAVDIVSTGMDGSLTYYVLNWKGTGNRAYCQSGVTCSGVAGAHGTRGYAWYRMNLYQNRVLKTRTVTTQSGWGSAKDPKAVRVTYRYKRR